MSTQVILTPSTPAPAPSAELKATPGVPGQSATSKPAEAKAAEAEAPKAPEYYEVKVNGQTRKYTREQLIAKASLAEAATERFQAAAEKEKKHNAWKERAQKDFLSALQDPEMGLSRDQIRDRFEQWYKTEFIDPEMMSQEQREAAKWKKEAEQKDQRIREYEEKQKTQAEEAEAEATRQSVQQDVIGIIEKSGLPKTRFTASRVAFWMKQNLHQGFDAPPEVIIQQVKEELSSVHTSAVGELTGEALVNYLGEDVVKKIREYDMGRLKSKYQVTGNDAPVSSDSRKSSNTKSMKDVDNYFNELRRTRR